MKTGGIIVEGGEQQGKTTFCDKLTKRLGIEVVHFGPASPDFDYFSGYFVDIDTRGGPFIFDRSFVSELAYGKIFNRKNITPEILKKVQDRFTDLGYFLVLLELNRPWIDRAETVTKEQNERVKQAYREIFPTLSMDKFVIEPSDESVEFVAKQYEIRK
jgi:thymidylate kinase